MGLPEPNHNILEPQGLIGTVVANHTILSWFESKITINVDLAHKLLLDINEASDWASSFEIRGVYKSHIILHLQMNLKLILPRDISIEVVDNFVIFYYFAVSHVANLGFVYIT